MRNRTRKPTHPGAIIRHDYMEPLELGVTALAQRLGVSRKTLSKILNERGCVTPDMALRLSRAFNTTPDLWLNLQQTHDLWLAANKDSGWKDVHALPGLDAADTPHPAP